jgi:hypothetical protein
MWANRLRGCVIFRLSDWKRACLAATALLGIALFIVFAIHPGGFEGQIGWFFGLVPGALVGAILADMVYKVVPSLERVVQWFSIIGVSFLWYFVISYAAIKTCRWAARMFAQTK